MWRVLTWLEILVVAVAKNPTLEASEQMNLLLDAMYMELIYIYIYIYIHGTISLCCIRQYFS
jgi:hypothetical protein